MSRREMLGASALGVSTLGVGFALAVQPVEASVITTDSQGLEAGFVEIKGADGVTFRAYRAKPAAKKNLPTILVVSEIFGLHEHILDVTRRFAKAGFYAIAADYFVRQGDPTKIADIQTLFTTVIAKTPDAQVMADADATLAFAAGDGGLSSKAGITGFCWGGRITWLYAAHNPKLKAGVAWYGRLKGTPNALQTSFPLDSVAKLKAPVLGLYGALDKGIPLADVEAMQAALKAAQSPSQIILYPNSDHGFYADYRPSYDPAAASDAWARAVKWFQTNLG
jgi:carboxymethylenebutenolidase